MNVHKQYILHKQCIVHEIPLWLLGYFNTKEITEEVKELLDNEFPEFHHLKVVSHKLVRMMSGRSTAGLRQLATRTIFKQVFLQSTNSLGKLLPSTSLKFCLQNADLRQMDVYDEYINLVLNRTVLQALVVRLGLHGDSLVNFEVELLLHQMASRFSGFKILPPENLYSGESGESSVTEDSDLSTSQDEGDSDLEYWWPRFHHISIKMCWLLHGYLEIIMPLKAIEMCLVLVIQVSYCLIWFTGRCLWQ